MCGINENVNFTTAPVFVAVRFAVDFFPDRFLRRVGNKIPFGCHGWSKCSADAYTKIFRQAGYDLSPFRDKMGNTDYEFALEASLGIDAIKRLIREFKHGKSALQYLPTKKFASICVIRGTDTMKILAKLLTEDDSLTEKIFIYDEKNFMNLVNDMERENLPHLLLTVDYDKSLIGHIERRGLIYGEHFISFRREYLKHCEKIFHNLGK